MAEIAYRPFGKKGKEVRLIVRRVKPTPGSQLALFANYSYHAFITDREGETLDLEAITVTADPATRVYGTTSLTLTATLSGFAPGDSAAASTTGAPMCTTSADAASAVGPYAISCTLGTLASANYIFGSFVNGTLTVTPATLTITVADHSRLYGAANPALTGTIVGLQNGDAISATYTTVADATSAVGDYAIVAGAVDSTPDRLANYDVVLVNGTLTATPATLTITADAIPPAPPPTTSPRPTGPTTRPFRCATTASSTVTMPPTWPARWPTPPPPPPPLRWAPTT